MYSRQSSFQSIHCNCYHSCLCRMRHSENCSLLRSCQNSRFCLEKIRRIRNILSDVRS